MVSNTGDCVALATWLILQIQSPCSNIISQVRERLGMDIEVISGFEEVCCSRLGLDCPMQCGSLS